jgi:queuine tRNA-ribosyltransferase
VSAFSFALDAEDPSGARAGRLGTPHGTVETPVFMPVGTRGAMKAMTIDQAAATGAQILLANAYHLLQRPGPEVVAALGGLHRMMGWERALLTDSGGFQVFSLADRMRMDEDGVTFRSEIDGAEIRLTPERVVEVEEALGADVIMPLDHCIAFPAERRDVEAAVARTVRWAERSLAAQRRRDQALFPIVQGGVHADLRLACAESLVALGAPGYACGGLLVGEEKARTWEVLAATNAALPRTKPRYVMGIGTPEDFLDAVAAGADMMDCVLPTRNARHHTALTRDGPLRLRNARHERDDRPLDADCRCFTCRTHGRGYLRHLCRVGEATAATLLTIHNLTWMTDLARETRAAVLAGEFDAHRSSVKARLGRASQVGGEDDR